MPLLDLTFDGTGCTDTFDGSRVPPFALIPAEVTQNGIDAVHFHQARLEAETEDPLAVELPPFPDCVEKTSDGAIRLTGHRVSLYLILDSIFSGTPTDEIRSMYPTISPQQLWDVIVFSNHHFKAMHKYYMIKKAEEEAQNLSHRNTIPSLEDIRANRDRRRNQG